MAESKEQAIARIRGNQAANVEARKNRKKSFPAGTPQELIDLGEQGFPVAALQPEGVSQKAFQASVQNAFNATPRGVVPTIGTPAEQAKAEQDKALANNPQVQAVPGQQLSPSAQKRLDFFGTESRFPAVVTALAAGALGGLGVAAATGAVGGVTTAGAAVTTAPEIAAAARTGATLAANGLSVAKLAKTAAHVVLTGAGTVGVMKLQMGTATSIKNQALEEMNKINQDLAEGLTTLEKALADYDALQADVTKAEQSIKFITKNSVLNFISGGKDTLTAFEYAKTRDIPRLRLKLLQTDLAVRTAALTPTNDNT